MVSAMVSRGQIYFVSPSRGREQARPRPVLVVSSDAINRQPLVVTVVVGTSGETCRAITRPNVRVPAAESGLPKDPVFLCFQIRFLDSGLFGEPAGRLPAVRMEEVGRTLRLSLDLGD